MGYFAETIFKISICFAILFSHSHLNASHIIKTGENNQSLNSFDSHENLDSLINLTLNYINKKQYDIALTTANKVLHLAQQEKNTLVEARTYLSIGTILSEKSNFSEAQTNYLKALKLLEQLDQKLDIARTKNNLGNLFRKIKNYDKAIDFLRETIDIYKELNKPNDLAGSLINLGAVYYEVNNYNEALVCFKMALSIYKTSEQKELITLTENNIGSVLLELNMPDSALVYYYSTLNTYKFNYDTTGIIDALANIGNTHNQKKDYKNAAIVLTDALKYESLHSSIESRLAICGYLSATYSGLKLYEKAFEYQKQYATLYDSLYSAELAKQTAEMQTQYETEKKEKENEILREKNKNHELESAKNTVIVYSLSALALLFVLLAFFIFRGYKQKHSANLLLSEKNKLIESKSKIVEEQNKDIKDSIRYAKRLQEAILSPTAKFSTILPQSFILFKPKDIVSGDFYWFEKWGDEILFAAADCTGHGVPGAFMSILGYNLLNQSVNEYGLTSPAAILNSANKGLSKALHQNTEDYSVKDGMDIAVCCLNKEKNILRFSGAFNPLWIVRNKELMEFNANKFSVGAAEQGVVRQFTEHTITLQKNDSIYLFSDGYADQFGGPKGKKFKYKQFQELLLSVQDKSMEEQEQILSSTIEAWRGNLEQVDDILVMGIKI